MPTDADPIAFLRFVLRSGDIELAERVTRALRSDARYSQRTDAMLQALGLTGFSRHSTPGGQMLDSLLERFAPPGHN